MMARPFNSVQRLMLRVLRLVCRRLSLGQRQLSLPLQPQKARALTRWTSPPATAWEALQRIDKAIDKVSSARGELGALQTRFEKAENIDIQNETSRLPVVASSMPTSLPKQPT
jgi:hypothetical protein